ncbi:YciI family protein [Acidaminobacter hydrogenoformans]|uniref:YCII-related domain-containing protein n=1 Tax=Acidaminobacter hydrogenoformans DSM 2784 TaxID=1120920 RepID=A0A1G5RTB9_9FIRM|nr:YciI family protein [Acidaminobacter hydrogenoformans]SCZ76549.1 hypothetical protein SAMN03080599_00296 [Acidaminobacter hydrogenoformans DSM 2784]
MQFIVIGRDGTDEGAMARRQAVRDNHLALAQKLKAEGKMLYAAALLDEEERMVGSAMFMEFEDRAALDAWLDVEPYIIGDVWRDIEVTQCKIPSFIKP